MEIKTSRRSEEKIETKILIISVGESRYTISETPDKRLNINKVSDEGDDYLKVHPRSGNEIEIS